MYATQPRQAYIKLVERREHQVITLWLMYAGKRTDMLKLQCCVDCLIPNKQLRTFIIGRLVVCFYQ